MRIPEASANSGPYYSEEGAPWQNGVMMDGAHAVGAAGDAAYAHPAHIYTQPQRPPHMPPGPGYMVTGAPYYAGYAPPAPPVPDDFSDYMWMENEEEFDKQVMQQLEEEALMEQCIEAMLEDERTANERERVNGHGGRNGGPGVSLEEQVSKSTLNPLAAEFVPTRSAAPTTTASAPAVSAIEKATPVEVSANDVVTDVTDKSPETPAQTEPTEHNDDAATAPDAESKPNDSRKSEEPKVKCDGKKAEAKKERPRTESKPAKSEVKQQPAARSEVKPARAKSEAKVAPKTVKKDVRSVKSEGKVEAVEPKPTEVDVVAPAQDAVKSQPNAIAEPNPATATPVFKPINYAAAARANKPRKPSDPTATPAPK